MLLLAILHTWPLAARGGDTLPGLGLADNVTFVWNLWWFRYAWIASAPPFSSPLLLAPIGARLVLHTHTALQGALAVALLRVVGSVGAQNLLLIGSLALNGVTVAAVARAAGADRAAAVAAGALFLVSPAVAGRLMGHFNLVAVWPLALACLAWMRLLQPAVAGSGFRQPAVVGSGSRQPSVVGSGFRQPSVVGSGFSRIAYARAAAFGVAVAVVAYGDYYLLVYTALFAACYAAASCLTWEIRASRRPGRVRPAALASVAAVLFGLALAIHLGDARVVSIAGVEVSVRSPLNALMAAWVMVAAALLAAWRVRVRAGRRAPGDGGGACPPVRLLALAALAAAVLMAPLVFAAVEAIRAGDYITQSSSLKNSPAGIDLATLFLGPPWHGMAGGAVRALYGRLGIDAMESSGWIGVVPAVLAVLALRRWREDRAVRVWGAVAAVFLVWSCGAYLRVAGVNVGLLLPQALARYIPILDNARIPGRAMIVVAMAAAVLGALALSRLRGPRRGLAIGMVAAVGVAEAVAAPLPLVTLPVSPVVAALRDGPPGAVLPIPFGVRDGFGERGRLDHSAIALQMAHGRPIVGGFVARIPPSVLDWYARVEPYRTLLRASAPGAGPATLTCADAAVGLQQASVRYVVVNRDLASPELVDLVRRQLPVVLTAQDAHYQVLTVGSCPPPGVK